MMKQPMWLACLFLPFVLAAGASAATIVVDTGFDAEFGDGPSCTLREAVESTNGNADFGGCIATGTYNSAPGFDTIMLFEDEYYLEISKAGSTNATGSLNVEDNLIIEGEGRDLTLIDGTSALDRVIFASADLDLRRLTIQNGRLVNGDAKEPFRGAGGGVFVDGKLTTLEVVVEFNSVVTPSGPFSIAVGGGIAAETVDLDATIVRHNEAEVSVSTTSSPEIQQLSGGGLYLFGVEDSVIRNSSIVDNTVTNLIPPNPKSPIFRGSGGAAHILLDEDGGGAPSNSVEITNTTIAGNTAPVAGAISVDVFCFVAGTMVSTDTGLRPIEQVQEGDRVWAWNESNGQLGLQLVSKTQTPVVRPTLRLRLANGEIITTTAEHPFWVHNLEWRPAGDIAVGDRLYTKAGLWLEVEDVAPGNFEPVFTLSVANVPTFFVSGSEVLVHNKP